MSSATDTRPGQAPAASLPEFRIDDRIAAAAAALGPGPLSEAGLRAHIRPLFSRVLLRREIYLANHSLGRPLDMMADDVARALDAWYADMDGAWGLWLNEMTAFRAGVARLIGAARGDAVVPRPSAGAGLRSVLNALPTLDTSGRPPTVIASAGEFDSIDFILRTYALKGRIQIRWVPGRVHEGVRLIDADGYLEAIRDAQRPSLVVCSQIIFATGQVLDGVDRIVAAARAAGAWSMLDTYHSAGVVPVDFDRLGADFAIGGSYKYTRGGPGACWLAIHPKHLPLTSEPEREGKPRTLDTGWFAKLDTFKYQRPEQPLLSPGGDAWLESTMPVLPFFQARSGLHLTLALGVERLRAYSMAQQRTLAAALRERGVPLRELASRGAFLLVPHADAPGWCERLKPLGVNADARAGHVRLCPDILNTEEELHRAAEVVRASMGA